MALSRTQLGAIVTTLLGAAALLAQIPSTRERIYSRPAIPSAESLRRLNLTQQWRAYVPMAGARDGLLQAHLDGKDLFVLTRSGMVMRLDAETGVTRWRARVGAKPYTMLPYVAVNTRSVLVIANATLVALQRGDGSKAWDFRLTAGISAPPAVDDEQIYLPGVDERLYAYYLPFASEAAGAESPVYGERALRAEVRPTPVWEEQTNITLSFRPVQTTETLMVVGPSGRAFGFWKTAREGTTSHEAFRFDADGKVTVAPGHYGEMGYVGTDNGALYAINLTTGRQRWRHVAGTEISRRPVALEGDLFVTSKREGMARLDRATGDSLWRVPARGGATETNREADRFLAANSKYVYAFDESNRLLVLDRKRGARLSLLDTTGFRFPVVNEITDRLYLAANDGLIVCLRDREQLEPIRHKAKLEEASSPTRKILETKVSMPSGKPTALRDVLAQLNAKYKLRFVVAEQAFKQAGLANVQDRQISTPRADERPLKDQLQRILNLVKATYLLRDDTILIIPGKPEEK